MLPIVLIALPLFAGFIGIFLSKKYSVYLALLIGILSIIFAFQAFNILPDHNPDLLFEYRWLPYWGVNLLLQIDGINILFILLSGVIFTLVYILSMTKEDTKRHFYPLSLFMLTGLNLLFLAQDGFSFYFGWELTLIPIYLMNLLESNKETSKIYLRFFIYTVFGSLFMLLALIFLRMHNPAGTFDWYSLIKINLSHNEQIFVFVAFALAFLIKVPVFPFHTWQPVTYFQSPTLNTILLSAVMMKMGIYGFIKWLLPIAAFPTGVEVVLILSIISAVYAAIVALAQSNYKKMLAYSSMSHGALMVAGICSFSEVGLTGSILQSFNHAIYVLALFMLLIFFDKTRKDYEFKNFGGLAKNNVVLTIFIFISLLSAIGFPLSGGFVGEFMLLKSVFDYGCIYVVIIGLSVIFGAIYMFSFFNKVFFGESDESPSIKISPTEILVMGVIIFFILWVGISPSFLTNKIQPYTLYLQELIEIKKLAF